MKYGPSLKRGTGRHQGTEGRLHGASPLLLIRLSCSTWSGIYKDTNCGEAIPLHGVERLGARHPLSTY